MSQNNKNSKKADPVESVGRIQAYPFTAIVGQDEVKLGLILNLIDPLIGGVLMMGHRGTGKSTAVRAVADLLPDIAVSEGCSFGCDPNNGPKLCTDCAQTLAETGRLKTKRARVPVVDLPLGATEDRVCGSINIQRALSEGVTAFEPGLLARANRGFLYIDEVNLLEDHLVDLLLDVAVTGRNVVERENISIEHAAEFVLVGSGNPEEGELRPQLIDRFGLYVQVETENDPDERVEILSRREAFDRDRDSFLATYAEDQKELQRRITRARKMMTRLELRKDVLRKIARLCSELKVEGHRGELTIMRAARALAAFEGRKVVRDDDVRRVAVMSLRHRLHGDSISDTASEPRIQQAFEKLDSEDAPRPASEGINRAESNGNKPRGNRRDSGGRGSAETRETDSIETTLTQSFRDEHLKERSGSRMRKAKAGARDRNFHSGRYIQSGVYRNAGRKLAIDATLRALFSSGRMATSLSLGPGRLRIDSEQLRFKRFSRKHGTLFIFAIDTSGSMAAERIRKAKGAILSLLQDSYVNRDDVAVVAFRGNDAKLLLPPSRSIIRARRALDSLAIGGGTPLSSGLKCSLAVAERAFAHHGGEPILLLFTDGGANVSLKTPASNDRLSRKVQIENELAQLGERLRASRVKTFVVETNSQFRSTGRAESLAQILGAKHLLLNHSGS